MKFATNDFADSSVARIEKPAARLYDESYGNSAIEAMKLLANKKAKAYENSLPELSFCDKEGNKIDKDDAIRGAKKDKELEGKKFEKDGGMKDNYLKKFEKDGGMKDELPEGKKYFDDGGMKDGFSEGKKIIKDGGPKDPVGDVQVGGGDKKPPAAEVQVGGGQLKDWFRGENREGNTPSDNGTSSGRSDGNFQPNLPGYQEGENR
ncbi:MAG: hypothetical protein HY986_24755 [Candidatus Melainabacteria bacterium]|nr:hypothetical protein [Candidatus Melainabacteria bacterium]